MSAGRSSRWYRSMSEPVWIDHSMDTLTSHFGPGVDLRVDCADDRIRLVAAVRLWRLSDWWCRNRSLLPFSLECLTASESGPSGGGQVTTSNDRCCALRTGAPDPKRKSQLCKSRRSTLRSAVAKGGRMQQHIRPLRPHSDQLSKRRFFRCQ